MKHILLLSHVPSISSVSVHSSIGSANGRFRGETKKRLLLILRIVIIVFTLLLVIELQLGVWSYVSSYLFNAHRSHSHSDTHILQQLRRHMSGTGAGESTRLPRIVLWTKFYDHYDYTGTGVKSGPGMGMWADCDPPCQCEVVYVNTTVELRENDAIIFHLRNLERAQLPAHRSPDQIWILFSLEAPPHARFPKDDPGRYSHVFNWTMSYRQDSDVYYPYGVVTKKASNPQRAYVLEAARLKEVVGNKTRLAGVGMTHCNTPSNRESYIRTLQQYTQADVFGLCSRNSTCAEEDDIRHCKTMECKFAQFRTCYASLARSHKFYLSFENSLCVDYVTEKFFMALQYDIVPIVYGSANYAKVAPPFSYINAREFGSPAELGKYLNWLAMNPEAYAAYFRWKPYYIVNLSQTIGWCALCNKLRTRQEDKGVGVGVGGVCYQSYGDIQAWWKSQPLSFSRPAPACEKRPKYEYEGWEDARINYQY